MNDFMIGPQSDKYEQMGNEEWDRELREFEEIYGDFYDDLAAGYEEFEPGREYWDEMAANP